MLYIGWMKLEIGGDAQIHLLNVRISTSMAQWPKLGSKIYGQAYIIACFVKNTKPLQLPLLSIGVVDAQGF